MRIKRFLINTSEKSITIDFIHGDTACLSFEYLRVFTPMAKQNALVSHKKHVVLTSIENVGKHGYRFIFDDQHSAIYSTEYLIVLINEDGGWPMKFSYKRIQSIEKLNDRQYFDFVTNNYIAQGGDNCSILKTLPQEDTGILLRQMVIDYLKVQKTIKADNTNYQLK